MFLFVYTHFLHVYAHFCMWYQSSSEEDAGSPGTRVSHVCDMVVKATPGVCKNNRFSELLSCFSSSLPPASVLMGQRLEVFVVLVLPAMCCLRNK